MMKILAIHDGHNASAAASNDGVVVAAVQEERLSREKNQFGFPSCAIKEVLSLSNLSLEEIDRVGINGFHLPLGWRTREELLARYEKTRSLLDQVKWRAKQVQFIDFLYQHHLRKQRMLPYKAMGIPQEKIVFVDHHYAHASAAYYGWGRTDEKVLVLTCDGAGDRICASVYQGYHGKLEKLADIPEFNSVGSLFSRVTYLMGMIPLEHEYKIMGLAPYAYGSPQSRRVAEKFLNLFDFDLDNLFRWKRKKYVPALFYATDFLKDLLYRERFDWVAAGLQIFLEEFLVQWVKNCIKATGIRKLALSGGVFMNVKANKRIMDLAEVDNLFVFPSCGDETNVFGICYSLSASQKSKDGSNMLPKPLEGFYYGREFTNEEVRCAISAYNFNSRQVEVTCCEDIEQKVAELLAEKQIVARFKGRSEFGARALGNRSIIANPGVEGVVRVINDMIKNRDFWMPFAPSVLEEKSQMYYYKSKKIDSPYMVLSFDGKKDRAEKFIAAAHPYDFTLRPQEVVAEHNLDYYRLLKCFESITGEGVLLNTSLNLHGYPIVYTPQDALDVLMNSGLKYLSLENYLIRKC